MGGGSATSAVNGRAGPPQARSPTALPWQPFPLSEPFTDEPVPPATCKLTHCATSHHPPACVCGPTLDHEPLVLLSTHLIRGCLLYTSDAADERSSVDLGGR